MIRHMLADLIRQALMSAQAAGDLPAFDAPPDMYVERPQKEGVGDLTTTLPLKSARLAKMAPLTLADVLVRHMPASDMIGSMVVSPPGFLNVTLSDAWLARQTETIIAASSNFGRADVGKGRRVQVEFVSANPTGPLHIGHGRGAALGDALANLLAATGHRVEREYYINDVGTQMLTLGKSLYYRIRELQGEEIEFPADGYQGDYLKDLARQYLEEHGPLSGKEPDEAEIAALGRYAGDRILADIDQDLRDFGVRFDHWFSEASLYREGWVDRAIERLQRDGLLYEKEGALWFAASRFGDDKDRVVRRSSGATTYFASDIAYHLQKFSRTFDLVVDLWGADHHGYVPRLLAAAEALGFRERLRIQLVQLVTLLRQGEPVAMTTRGGTFVTLREVIDEVGKDAARFIFLTRRSDAHLDFDLEVAKQQNLENPVYYVQYAHARLASVFRQPGAQGLAEAEPDPSLFSLLSLPEELELAKKLAAYPEVVEGAALFLEPHRITYFLTELASQLHSYYNKHRFISVDLNLTKARLALVKGVKTVLAHGLGLLGVSAPETM